MDKVEGDVLDDGLSFAEELSLPCPVCQGKSAGFYGRMAAQLIRRNDELRKAAEELQAYLKSSHLDTQIPRHIINNFSASLEKK